MKGWAIVKKSNSYEFKTKYDFSNFELTDFEMPTPGDDEVVVKVKAISINPVDYKMMCGWVDFKFDFPWIPGVDCSGEIHSIGKNVKNVVIGDRIMLHDSIGKRNSCFAEYVCCPSHVVTKVPKEISFEEAAGIPCAGLTSYQAIVRRLKVDSGKNILIHCGSGGTGSYAIQICKALGLTVYTTCSKKNFSFVKSLGADVAIDYQTEDINKRILELTNGEGLYYVYNTLSPERATEDLKLLRFGGEIASICGRPDMSGIKPFTKCVSFHEIGLGMCYLEGTKTDQEDLVKMGTEFLQMYQKGQIKTVISQVFEFKDLKTAVQKLLKREVKPGKVIVKV